jgi:ubiquinone/menaquinone biosynthesis C-methylase UbiE
MKIDYRETTKDLLTRIDIHTKYGSRDIDEWMLEILAPEAGLKILDIGCGAGKLCFSFNDHVEGNCTILGGDVSDELLEKAKAENETRRTKIQFGKLNFNERFPYDDNQFDLVSCSFAIYYAENIPYTIEEMHRVLKPGGRLFTIGPMPENKQLFYDIIHEATSQTIPPMPGSSRYKSEILSAIKEKFPRVDVYIFENPLTFDKVDPFISYTRASLSEDRKLWNKIFQGDDTFDEIMNKITKVARQHFERDGKLVMVKVVGGFIGVK